MMSKNECCPVYDIETEEATNELQAYLLINELLSQIQILKKEIVDLRKEVNSHISAGTLLPYPFPVSDLPGSCAYCDMPAMKRYEQFFGEYIPEY